MIRVVLSGMILLLWSARPGAALAVSPPTIAQITHAGLDVRAAADIAIRDSSGRSRQGANVGATLSEVYVEVPADDTIVVAAPNGHDSLTLEPSTTAYFHNTGSTETVSVSTGKVADDDAYGFFSHISGAGGIVLTAPSDPTFTLAVDTGSAIVLVESGDVQASLLMGQKQVLVGRTDNLSTTGRSTITYNLVSKTADVTAAGDEADADRGNAEAEYNLALRYLFGDGVQRDAASAVDWLQRAAVNGNGEAANALGMMYYNCEVPREKVGRQMGSVNFASLETMQPPETRVAWYLNPCWGDQRYIAGSLRWLQLGVADGNANAAINLGDLDIKGFGNSGLGLKHDPEAGLRLYQLALDQGDIAAAWHIGTYYYGGNGTTALRWDKLPQPRATSTLRRPSETCTPMAEG